MLTIILSLLHLQAGDIVLDIGCGEGRHVIHACMEYPIQGIGVDLSPRDLTTAQSRFAPFADYNPSSQFYLQQADATCLPFADASVDKIICSEVLEHISDYHAVLREIYRVLKPGGLLAVSVPRAWPERLCWWLSEAYHQVEGGHIRIFNARDLRNCIEAEKFSFTHHYWAHALHSPFWWLKCLLWKRQENSWLIKKYHQLLVWDLMKKALGHTNIREMVKSCAGKKCCDAF